jgi:general secretion pathway protein B
MSFILDALKKAESERNRQFGPVLMDARIAPPRRTVPAWGWVLAAVLLVNLVALAWLLLRSPAADVLPRVADDDAADAAPLSPAVSAAAASAQTSPPAAQLPAVSAGPGVGAPAAPDTSVSLVPAVRDSSPSLSSDAEALPTVQDLLAQGVVLPDLQLNLHIYDPEPAHRSVLLNGQRLREGQFTPSGVRVERITEQSVVLEAAGRRFRLVAGG